MYPQVAPASGLVVQAAVVAAEGEGNKEASLDNEDEVKEDPVLERIKVGLGPAPASDHNNNNKHNKDEQEQVDNTMPSSAPTTLI